MLKIISAADGRAIARLFEAGSADNAAVARRVAAIVADVRRGGDRAVLAYARRFDRLEGPAEITRREMEAGAGAAPPRVRRALRTAARHIRRVARTQVPRGSRLTVAPGLVVEQRVTPLARVGCYVPGGRYPLPSSLLMTAIPAAVAGVDEVIVCCPRPDAAVMAAAIEAGVSRLFRLGGAHAVAALAYGTATMPRVDKIVGPGNAYVAAAKALVSRDCGIDFYAGPSEIVVVSTGGNPEWIAADLLAQAEHDVDARAILLTSSKRLANAVYRAVQAHAPEDGPAREALRRRGAIVLTRNPRESIELANRLAPEHLVVDDARTGAAMRTAGAIFVGPWSAQAAGDYATGSNHVLPTSGAARFRGGLSAADFVRVSSVQTISRAGLTRLAPTIISLAEAEGLRQHARSVARPPGPGAFLSEHRVLPIPARARPRRRAAPAPEREHRRVLTGRGRRASQPRRCRRGALSGLPAMTAACAAYLGVDEDWLLVTNGLDEGLLAAAMACLQRARGVEPEAVIIEPAFGMYADCVEATGGRIVSVQPRPSFEFPLEETLASLTAATRLVFVTSPGNPTGVLVSADAIRTLALAVPPEALVFVDEAYAEFTDEHFLPYLEAHPNVVVGRTFAKAQGLAGLRVGAVVAVPETLARLRRSLPPYSINVAAAVALVAALADGRISRRIASRWAQSRELVYAMCRKLGLEHWRSHANFVLVRVGDEAPQVVEALRGAAIFVRDRSSQPGCAGCIRITTGHASNTPRRACARSRRCCAPRADRSKDHRNADRVKLGIEGRGSYAVTTGIRFLDHMLELFARHGAFDLEVTARGDLDVDQHHTVEDLGIALGEAVSSALGDRRGINRAGYFVMPMDETLAVAAIDLGGRPHAVVDLRVRVRLVGRSADRARARLLRRLRHRRARQRPRQGALRPLEPPSRRSRVQGLRPRAARRVRPGSTAAQDAAQHERTLILVSDEWRVTSDELRDNFQLTS